MTRLLYRNVVMLLLMVLMVPAVVNAQDDPANQRYATSDESFSFEYPASWVSNNDNSGRVFITRSSDILDKSYADLIPGEYIIQVQSPLFTQQLVQIQPTADVQAVMDALIEGLGDGVTVTALPAAASYNGRAVVQSTVSTGDFEVVLMTVAVGEASSASVALIFGFVPPSSAAAALEPMQNIAASMTYQRPIVNRAALSPMSIGNGNQLSAIGVWPGHYSGVRNVAIRPDGTWVASVDETSVLQVRDSQTGEILFEHSFERVITAGPVFTADGRRVLLGTVDGGVFTWDIEAGAIAQEFPDMSDTVWDVAISPDDATVVAVGRDLTARAWDAATGELLVIMSGHRDDVVSVAFAGSSEQIFTASLDGTLRLWNIPTGNQLLLIAGSNRGLTSVAVNESATLVAASAGDGALYVWDVATQDTRWIFAEEEDAAPIQALTFGSNGTTLLAAGQDGTLRIWEAVNGVPITALTGPSFMNDVAISIDDRLVIGANDAGVILIWGVQ